MQFIALLHDVATATAGLEPALLFHFRSARLKLRCSPRKKWKRNGEREMVNIERRIWRVYQTARSIITISRLRAVGYDPTKSLAGCPLCSSYDITIPQVAAYVKILYCNISRYFSMLRMAMMSSIV